MFIKRRSALKISAGAILAATMSFAVPAIASAQEQPDVSRGGVIRASMYQQPVSLYPLEGNASIGDHFVYNQIFDPLIRTAADGSYEPALAESWEFTNDNTVLTFKLREGVVFHDGTPFNAQAVAKNFELAMRKENSADPHFKDLANIDSFEVVDDYTIQFNLKSASGAALVPFSMGVGFISSPTALEASGDDYGRHPVGTGPFKFVRWQSDEFIEMARNENYWAMGADGSALPYTDGVTMRFVSESATKIIEVQSGNLDIADEITPREARQLEGDDRGKLVDPPPGGLQSWLAFNTQKAPFDKVEVRRAVVQAIDREGLLKAIALGVGSVPPCIFSPSQWAYDDSVKQAAYDPAAAKAAIDAAGASGAEVQLSIIQRDPDSQIAQIVQAQLAQVGLKVEINVMERGAYVQSVLGSEHQFALGRWPLPFGDPDAIAQLLFGPDAALDWSNINDSVLEKMVVDGRSAIEPADRKPHYVEMCNHVTDAAYYDFLMMRGVKHLANPKLYGWTYELTGAWNLATAYFAK